MKLCAACSQELPKNEFSKKQWQLKQQRRCKECIADNREVVNLSEAPSDAAPQLSNSDGEGASDEELFRPSPPREECPICFLQLPVTNDDLCYQPCCGKTLCYGCIHAAYTADPRQLCPFCRTPEPTSDGGIIERIKKRAEAGDSEAMYNLGVKYFHGRSGLRQNIKKANKLWLRAGELGDADAYNNLGASYIRGQGVDRDERKARCYWELAAMGGHAWARFNLGSLEYQSGNMNRAVRHWMISARAGHDDSLTNIRSCFMHGDVTKDEFEKALRSHKETNDEMKSDQREIAAAAFLASHQG